MAPPLIQIARVLVRFDHVARLNRNHAYAVETRGVDVVALKKREIHAREAESESMSIS